MTIYSAHDEELSTSKNAPKDTLTVTGGNAAAGADGTMGEKKEIKQENIQQVTTAWIAGSGGNGGGGAAAAIGGGAECSKAEDKSDNKSQGGSGGSGGGVNGSGKSGSSGTSTGTQGHGYDNNRYDGEPGSGGKGASGVQGDRGSGGAGGKAVPLKVWHSPANLILSTAANINGYFWGDGGGKGTATEFTPRVVYDLMDCQITLTLSSYIYTGKQLRPTVQSVRYSSASDRDSKNIFASAITKTLPSSGYSISGYGENIHCPSGTVTVLGAQNGSRTTVQTNEAVIGSAEVTFTINKATLTAPITMDPSKPYLNQSATASLSTYTSATAGTGQLAAVWRGSTKKAEGPKVTWSVQNRAGTVTEANGLQAKVSLTNTTATVTATLSDMNDFNDYTATLSVNTQPLKSWTPTLSANTPHPRVPISVKLLSGITDPTYQWYANDTAISGATAQSYTPTAADIGKTLSVKVTPNAASGYLDTSASAGIGSGSNSTTTVEAPARSNAAFVSDEVCYLVNSKTSTGDKALWKQDIDNGNTPTTAIPCLTRRRSICTATAFTATIRKRSR